MDLLRGIGFHIKRIVKSPALIGQMVILPTIVTLFMVFIQLSSTNKNNTTTSSSTPSLAIVLEEGNEEFQKELESLYSENVFYTDKEKAIKYLDEMSYPVVIKASGLAAGKGVVIAQNRKEAEDTLNDMMTNKVFAAAGDTVVIEEFLDGVEISVLSITDSEVIIPFISAKDHKKISEKETGLNTGGMGVIAPNPYYTKTIEEKFIQNIFSCH